MATLSNGFQQVQIMKTVYGLDEIRLFTKTMFILAVKWNHWSEKPASESEEPLYRLSELFNVNHFIVSQASLYAIPFISKAQNLQHETLLHKLAFIVASEFKHRLHQLDQLHILPHQLRGVIEEKMSGNVNIVPELAFSVSCFFF